MAIVLKKVEGWRVTFGGELHSGWLPPEAAPPLPRPTQPELLDITIEQEGGGSGYLLIYEARPSATCAKLVRPEAILFKGKLSTTLSAWVCAGCGYVEFYADSPQSIKIASA